MPHLRIASAREDSAVTPVVGVTSPFHSLTRLLVQPPVHVRCPANSVSLRFPEQRRPTRVVSDKRNLTVLTTGSRLGKCFD